MYVKPLLSLTKQDLRDYMMERDLEWREDASNHERIYTRNKVRLDLVPIAQSIAGGEEALYKRVNALTEMSLQLREFMDEELESFRQVDPESTTHTLQLACPSESPIILGESFKQLSPLSQADALHGFICRITGETPPYHFMRKLVGFIADDDIDKSVTKTRSIDLTDQWAVSKTGDEIKVVNKFVLKQTRSLSNTASVHVEGITVTYPKVCILSYSPSFNVVYHIDYAGSKYSR
jgi:hypothetical protein